MTVVSSLQHEMVRRAAAEVGSAAAKRHADKMTKYFHVSDREGIKFFPVVVEALPRWGLARGCCLCHHQVSKAAGQPHRQGDC